MAIWYVGYLGNLVILLYGPWATWLFGYTIMWSLGYIAMWPWDIWLYSNMAYGIFGHLVICYMVYELFVIFRF
jgi:hypothetical protein